MVTHPQPEGVNKPVFLLLAALILGGLTWLLWPSDASEAELASAVEDSDASESPEQQRESKPRDLARETKAVVSGTVRAFGGPPLVDAQVCATPVPGQLRGLGEGKPICVRTGQDGHYRIEGLWPVRMQISASAAAHEPKLWRSKDARGRWREYATLVAGSETKTIDFELKAGGVKLAGVVKDLGGGEIEGARVSAAQPPWSPGEVGPAVTLSDAEGRFELWVAAGDIEVSASAEGYGSTTKQALAPSARVELFLIPESVLIGQVVHAETGEPVADATVEAIANEWFVDSDNAVRTDAEGRFRIGGLAPGIYKPIATRDDVHGQAAVQVHLGLGQTSASVEIRVHPMALVEGRVILAGTDEGCSAGHVTLVRTDDEADRIGTRTDDQGRVTLRAVRPGEYEVSVGCEGTVARDDYDNLIIAGEDRLDQVWEVREGQAIRGRVVDSEGEPVADAGVSAQMVVDAASARGQTTNAWTRESEDDGSFELAGLLPGRYEVMAYGDQPAPDAPLIVELPAGSDRNDIRIELLATGSIVGGVVDDHGAPQPGTYVRAIQPGGRWQTASAMADDQGNFVMEHVRTGEVRVQASENRWGEGSMRAPGTNDDDVQGERVEVVAGERVEVELRVESRTGVIRGKVLDEHGGPVDDAFVHAERMSDSATANAERNRASVRWDWDSQPILSDADGSFTIEDLAEGTYVVRGYRRGGGEAIAEGVAIGSTIELTIEPTGVLAGKVVVEGGPPPEKFTISISDRVQGLQFGDEFLRTEGRWELGELPAGKYEIRVESILGTTKVEVELEAGGRRDDVELVLEPRVTIRGRLIDVDTRAPVPGMEVNVRPRGVGFNLISSGKGERKRVSDAEGRFEVERAPTGQLNILATPRNWGGTGDYEWAFFARTIADTPAVQDLGDLELVARRLDPEQKAGDLGFAVRDHEPDIEIEDITMIVGLIRPGGPAAATELAVGDVIETIDGKSVLGGDSGRYQHLTRVQAGTTIELGIAGGKTITITAGPPL
jgi:hypothetical protein